MMRKRRQIAGVLGVLEAVFSQERALPVAQSPVRRFLHVAATMLSPQIRSFSRLAYRGASRRTLSYERCRTVRSSRSYMNFCYATEMGLLFP